MAKKIRGVVVAVLTVFVCGIGAGGAVSAQDAPRERIQKVRIVWDAVPDAVMYQLVITKGKSKWGKDVLREKSDIYDTGYELDTSLLQFGKEDPHWKVRALDIRGRALTAFTKPKPVAEEELNPDKPLVTSQSEKLPYAKIYPVYSWIPVAKAKSYEVQVFRSAGKNAATGDYLMKADTIAGPTASNYYDDDAYVAEGTYWWRVRAKNSMNRAIGDWSAPKYFEVKHSGVSIAALGDSITHGGGAVSTPPSYVLYDWETYAGLPILNMGCSGNTVEKMAARFSRDVVPFSPRVLVVMGGINNIRLGDSAEAVIQGLNQIKYKCLFQRIVPVFVTVTPINPVAMRNVSGIVAAPGWMKEQKKVNDWIRSQTYHVDVTSTLTADNGTLRADLSVDGLHPDVEGKRVIGETIGAYLRENFAAFLPQ